MDLGQTDRQSDKPGGSLETAGSSEVASGRRRRVLEVRPSGSLPERSDGDGGHRDALGHRRPGRQPGRGALPTGARTGGPRTGTRELADLRSRPCSYLPTKLSFLWVFTAKALWKPKDGSFPEETCFSILGKFLETQSSPGPGDFLFLAPELSKWT